MTAMVLTDQFRRVPAFERNRRQQEALDDRRRKRRPTRKKETMEEKAKNQASFNKKSQEADAGLAAKKHGVQWLSETLRGRWTSPAGSPHLAHPSPARRCRKIFVVLFLVLILGPCTAPPTILFGAAKSAPWAVKENLPGDAKLAAGSRRVPVRSKYCCVSGTSLIGSARM
jgi:hypothetical protein